MGIDSLDEGGYFLVEVEAVRVAEAPECFEEVVRDLLGDRGGTLVAGGAIVVPARASPLVVPWVPIVVPSARVVSRRRVVCIGF
jgi:hypothetical protein